MVKVVNGTTEIMVIKDAEELEGILFKTLYGFITTIFYDNGSVVQQNGIGKDWVQIKNADFGTEEAGKCRDCGEMIYEHEDYKYSDKGEIRIQWHEVEDDCLPKCVVCDQSIQKGQQKFKDYSGKYRHQHSDDCGQ